MFDLEQAISRWRKELLAARVASPIQLQELENHLREEIERRAKISLDQAEAFDFAVKKMGSLRALQVEFDKIAPPVAVRFVKLMGIACGLIAGSFSLWILFLLLAVPEVNFAGRMAGFVAVAVAILSWWHGERFLPVIPRQRVRTTAGLLCCLGSVLGMVISLPHFLEASPGAGLSVTRLLVTFIWAWTALATLAAVAYRLEDAAHKNMERHA